MDENRALAPHQPHELEEAEHVARGDRAPNVRERDEARPRGRDGVVQRARSVRRDDDVEAPHERGHEVSHVRLCAAGLGQRDEDQDAGRSL